MNNIVTNEIDCSKVKNRKFDTIYCKVNNNIFSKNNSLTTKTKCNHSQQLKKVISKNDDNKSVELFIDNYVVSLGSNISQSSGQKKISQSSGQKNISQSSGQKFLLQNRKNSVRSDSSGYGSENDSDTYEVPGRKTCRPFGQNHKNRLHTEQYNYQTETSNYNSLGRITNDISRSNTGHDENGYVYGDTTDQIMTANNNNKCYVNNNDEVDVRNINLDRGDINQSELIIAENTQ
jgi:hypothetical protein